FLHYSVLPAFPTRRSSDLTYYRGCWHVVSRGFLVRYRQGNALFERCLFFPNNRVLRSEDLHHSRGVAPSDFRPLRKIPYCCLPRSEEHTSELQSRFDLVCR